MNRLFLGLPVTVDHYDNLKDAFSSTLKGRWVAPDNLHLTLLFLGERYPVEHVCERLQDFTYRLAPMKITGTGRLNRSSILHGKVFCEALNTLHQELGKVFESAPQESFLPHVTLMRIKQIIDEKRFETVLASYDNVLIGRVEPVLTLYESVLKPDGADYRIVRRFES